MISETRTRLAWGETIALASLSDEDRGAVREAITNVAFGGAALESADESSDVALGGSSTEIMLGLLGLGPSRPCALSAVLTKTEGLLERRTLKIRILDDRGIGLRLPIVGSY